MKKRSMLLAAVLTGTMMGTLVSGSVMAEEESYTIGISQFAEHGSLDNCREGFLEGLKEAGIEEGVNLEVIFENAQSDTGTASTISDSFVSQGVDMICAIATPSAMSAYNSCMDTDIPVIYIENAKNVYFNQGNIGWDGVDRPHYTHAIEAVKVDNLRLNNMTAAPSPSNPELPAVMLRGCRNVVDHIGK